MPDRPNKVSVPESAGGGAGQPVLTSETQLRNWSLLVLSLAAVMVLSQASVPIEKFIHRGDDAFYYFQLAANYPRVGYWSFDQIHTSNGVQPLWAMVLTTAALALDWLGIQDKDVLARVFVLLAAIANVASAFVLFHLLTRAVSIGTGIAAAGAFLLPMGIVWQRVWGMETSLYALLLVSTVAVYHLNYLGKPTYRGSLLLGALLGLTTLARLNAGLFIPCLLAHFLLMAPRPGFITRLKLTLVAGCSAGLLVGSYLAYNWLTTDHFLPVSGAIKQIGSANYLAANGIDTPFSLLFWKQHYEAFRGPILWFIKSRSLDGMWLVGSRVVFGGDSGALIENFLLFCTAVLLLPALLGHPLEWLRFLTLRLRRLSVFGYVLLFGVVDALVSTMLYPLQAHYAMIKWWFVENEIVLAVATGTVSVAALAFVGGRFLNHKQQARLVPLALCALVAYQAQIHVKHYWFEGRRIYDWNLSANEEMYYAAKWLNANVRKDIIVGAWNAGILGYYSDHRVVNLDGVINNYEFLPYLREGRINEYIHEQGIEYLADFQSSTPKARPTLTMFNSVQRLRLELVYSNYSEFLGTPYRIYKVLQ